MWSLIKGQGDDARRRQLSSNADFNIRPDGARCRRDVRHSYIFLQERRRTTTCYAPCFATRNRNRISVAANALIEHFESYKLACEPRLLLFRQNVAAEESAFVHFADPAEAG